MQQRQYDVVLVDPYLTGGLAIDLPQIRQLQPAATIIVLTGYATPALRAAHDSDEIDLVEKPQPVQLIGDLITAVLRQTKNSIPASPRSGVGHEEQTSQRGKGETR